MNRNSLKPKGIVITFIGCLILCLCGLVKLADGESDRWLIEGQRHAREKRFSEALAAFDRFKLMAPGDPRSYFYSGLTLSLAGYLKEASVEIEKAARLGPDRPEYALAYADVLYQLGEKSAVAEVLEAFEKKK